jgi:four helix bundle protein
MIKSFKDLLVYHKAFEQPMQIFQVTRGFPRAEQSSLTDQVRRSSRSVCVNIGEAWRKRRYRAHFVSKLSDADAETTETLIWLDFSLECNYPDEGTYEDLTGSYTEIGKMLGAMISAPEKFCYESPRQRKLP